MALIVTGHLTYNTYTNNVQDPNATYKLYVTNSYQGPSQVRPEQFVMTVDEETFNIYYVGDTILFSD
jgi:hypothetical protein